MKHTFGAVAIALALALTGCGTAPQSAPLAASQSAASLTAQDKKLVKQQIKPLIKLYFKYLDDNNDGRVSRKELARNAPGPFLMNPYFDKNKDKHLDYNELLELMGTTIHNAAKLLYAAADTNFDGKVTREDTKKIPFSKYLFALMDANDDGLVTLAEMEKFVTAPANFKSAEWTED